MNTPNQKQRSKNGSAIALNNLGANLILQGRHNEALKSLVASLKIAKTALARERSNRTSSYCQPTSTATERLGQTSVLKSLLLNVEDHQSTQTPCRQTSPFTVAQQQLLETGNLTVPGGSESNPPASRLPASTADEPRLEKGDARIPQHTRAHDRNKQPPMVPPFMPTYIFSDPIMLCEQPPVCGRHRRCLMRMTAVIVFNMALCHHLIGRNWTLKLTDLDAESRDALKKSIIVDLNRAIALYTLSCRIQLVENVVLNELILLAHLNNLGQIHAMLGNRATSKTLFERLLSNVILCTERLPYDEERAKERRRFSPFYRNTAHFILRGPPLAPAA